MPPAMGQPINVVEKPSSTPGVARFEINRSLTGMGHEHYAPIDDVLGHRPVDELARRLFDTGASPRSTPTAAWSRCTWSTAGRARSST